MRNTLVLMIVLGAAAFGCTGDGASTPQAPTAEETAPRDAKPDAGEAVAALPEIRFYELSKA